MSLTPCLQTATIPQWNKFSDWEHLSPAAWWWHCHCSHYGILHFAKLADNSMLNIKIWSSTDDSRNIEWIVIQYANCCSFCVHLFNLVSCYLQLLNPTRQRYSESFFQKILKLSFSSNPRWLSPVWPKSEALSTMVIANGFVPHPPRWPLIGKNNPQTLAEAVKEDTGKPDLRNFS